MRAKKKDSKECYYWEHVVRLNYYSGPHAVSYNRASKRKRLKRLSHRMRTIILVLPLMEALQWHLSYQILRNLMELIE